MSMTAVRAYHRSRAQAIGLTEWLDGFNFSNIPSNIIDKSFHLEMGVATALKLNQTDQEIEYPITVRMFIKGFRDPASGIDTAIQYSEDLIKQAVNSVNRLTQTTGIKNVIFETLSIDPIADSNDNLVVASCVFRTLVILKVD